MTIVLAACVLVEASTRLNLATETALSDALASAWRIARNFLPPSSGLSGGIARDKHVTNQHIATGNTIGCVSAALYNVLITLAIATWVPGSRPAAHGDQAWGAERDAAHDEQAVNVLDIGQLRSPASGLQRSSRTRGASGSSGSVSALSSPQDPSKAQLLHTDSQHCFGARSSAHCLVSAHFQAMRGTQTLCGQTNTKTAKKHTRFRSGCSSSRRF